MKKDFGLLDAEIRNCERCAEILAKYPEDPPAVLTVVRPRPVLSEPSCAAIMLVGQAPGLNEYRTGRTFSGDAVRHHAVVRPSVQMIFPGIKNETEAKNLWAYLKQFGADGKKK